MWSQHQHIEGRIGGSVQGHLQLYTQFEGSIRSRKKGGGTRKERGRGLEGEGPNQTKTDKCQGELDEGERIVVQ